MELTRIVFDLQCLRFLRMIGNIFFSLKSSLIHFPFFSSGIVTFVLENRKVKIYVLSVETMMVPRFYVAISVENYFMTIV